MYDPLQVTKDIANHIRRALGNKLSWMTYEGWDNEYEIRGYATIPVHFESLNSPVNVDVSFRIFIGPSDIDHRIEVEGIDRELDPEWRELVEIVAEGEMQDTIQNIIEDVLKKVVDP